MSDTAPSIKLTNEGAHKVLEAARIKAAEIGVPENAMINQAAIKSASLEVFERTFAVTAALNVLTLGVAGFAILMSLLTLSDIRVPQLAPVWALGLTRRALGQLELLRAVVLALIVFALPEAAPSRCK